MHRAIRSIPHDATHVVLDELGDVGHILLADDSDSESSFHEMLFHLVLPLLHQDSGDHDQRGIGEIDPLCVSSPHGLSFRFTHAGIVWRKLIVQRLAFQEGRRSGGQRAYASCRGVCRAEDICA